VTERDRAVAALSPAADSEEDRILLELAREGRVEWGGGKPEGLRPAIRIKGPSVAKAVIEDRR
jgi:hypothetical protein